MTLLKIIKESQKNREGIPQWVSVLFIETTRKSRHKFKKLNKLCSNKINNNNKKISSKSKKKKK